MVWFSRWFGPQAWNVISRRRERRLRKFGRRASLGWTTGAAVPTCLRLFLAAPHLQVGADEGLQVAIDHAVDVANFHLGAVIFDQPIRLQSVGADLRAEVDVQF